MTKTSAIIPLLLLLATGCGARALDLPLEPSGGETHKTCETGTLATGLGYVTSLAKSAGVLIVATDTTISEIDTVVRERNSGFAYTTQVPWEVTADDAGYCVLWTGSSLALTCGRAGETGALWQAHPEQPVALFGDRRYWLGVGAAVMASPRTPFGPAQIVVAGRDELSYRSESGLLVAADGYVFLVVHEDRTDLYALPLAVHTLPDPIASIPAAYNIRGLAADENFVYWLEEVWTPDYRIDDTRERVQRVARKRRERANARRDRTARGRRWRRPDQERGRLTAIAVDDACLYYGNARGEVIRIAR
jgi:hypothetical protein